MKEIEIAYRNRLLGIVNTMFKLIIQKKDDKIIMMIYKGLIELEPDQMRRGELLISEAHRNFRPHYLMPMNKMSMIDSCLR